MNFSLVICFKQSRVLLWVSQWKLHAEELYFPAPGSRWQRQCEMLLGMPASLGGFFCRSTAFLVWDQRWLSQPIQGTLVQCSEASHAFGAWILALKLWVLIALWE